MFTSPLSPNINRHRREAALFNNNVGTNELENLPFREIDFDNKVDCARHRKMVNLVFQMQEAKRQKGAANTEVKGDFWARKVKMLSQKIDLLVYELFSRSVPKLERHQAARL